MYGPMHIATTGPFIVISYLENGDTRFYFSSKEQKGYINRLDFRVNGTLAVIQDHPEFIDVVKLILPKPLLPGDSITISSSFHLQTSV